MQLRNALVVSSLVFAGTANAYDFYLSRIPNGDVNSCANCHTNPGGGGSRDAFGNAFETHVDFAKANVIASFDSDFLAVDGNNLRNAKTWGDRRRNPKAGEPMSRLYVYETCFSSTGTVADHRFPMKAQDVTAALLQLAAELGVGDGNDLGAALKGFKADNNKIRAIAKDLKSAGGNCAVVVGPRQPAAAHAIAHAINQVFPSRRRPARAHAQAPCRHSSGERRPTHRRSARRTPCR